MLQYRSSHLWKACNVSSDCESKELVHCGRIVIGCIAEGDDASLGALFWATAKYEWMAIW